AGMAIALPGTTARAPERFAVAAAVGPEIARAHPLLGDAAALLGFATMTLTDPALAFVVRRAGGSVRARRVRIGLRRLGVRGEFGRSRFLFCGGRGFGRTRRWAAEKAEQARQDETLRGCGRGEHVTSLHAGASPQDAENPPVADLVCERQDDVSAA